MRPALLPLLITLAACSSNDASDGDGARGGAPGTGGAPNNEPTCEGPGYGEDLEPQQVGSVSGLLVDEAGAAVPDEEVQVCGTDVCYFARSGASGRFAKTVDAPVRKPALKYGLGLETARFAWLIPDEPEVDFGTVRTVRLPEIGLGEPLVPGASASFEGFTLTLDPRTALTFEGVTFTTPDTKKLRAVRVPLDAAPAVIDPSLGFDLVYAATPTDTFFCPPAALRVENTEGWAPGSEVEVWLHGVHVLEEYAPYGGFAKVSDARVSDDGAVIETTEPGLPVLGVLGFKLK